MNAVDALSAFLQQPSSPPYESRCLSLAVADQLSLSTPIFSHCIRAGIPTAAQIPWRICRALRSRYPHPPDVSAGGISQPPLIDVESTLDPSAKISIAWRDV